MAGVAFKLSENALADGKLETSEVTLTKTYWTTDNKVDYKNSATDGIYDGIQVSERGSGQVITYKFDDTHYYAFLLDTTTGEIVVPEGDVTVGGITFGTSGIAFSADGKEGNYRAIEATVNGNTFTGITTTASEDLNNGITQLEVDYTAKNGKLILTPTGGRMSFTGGTIANGTFQLTTGIDTKSGQQKDSYVDSSLEFSGYVDNTDYTKTKNGFTLSFTTPEFQEGFDNYTLAGQEVSLSLSGISAQKYVNDPSIVDETKKTYYGAVINQAQTVAIAEAAGSWAGTFTVKLGSDTYNFGTSNLTYGIFGTATYSYPTGYTKFALGTNGQYLVGDSKGNWKVATFTNTSSTGTISNAFALTNTNQTYTGATLEYDSSTKKLLFTASTSTASSKQITWTLAEDGGVEIGTRTYSATSKQWTDMTGASSWEIDDLNLSGAAAFASKLGVVGGGTNKTVTFADATAASKQDDSGDVSFNGATTTFTDLVVGSDKVTVTVTRAANGTIDSIAVTAGTGGSGTWTQTAYAKGDTDTVFTNGDKTLTFKGIVANYAKTDGTDAENFTITGSAYDATKFSTAAADNLTIANAADADADIITSVSDTFGYMADGTYGGYELTVGDYTLSFGTYAGSGAVMKISGGTAFETPLTLYSITDKETDRDKGANLMDDLLSGIVTANNGPDATYTNKYGAATVTLSNAASKSSSDVGDNAYTAEIVQDGTNTKKYTLNIYAGSTTSGSLVLSISNTLSAELGTLKFAASGTAVNEKNYWYVGKLIAANSGATTVTVDQSDTAKTAVTTPATGAGSAVTGTLAITVGGTTATTEALPLYYQLNNGVTQKDGTKEISAGHTFAALAAENAETAVKLGVQQKFTYTAEGTIYGATDCKYGTYAAAAAAGDTLTVYSAAGTVAGTLDVAEPVTAVAIGNYTASLKYSSDAWTITDVLDEDGDSIKHASSDAVTQGDVYAVVDGLSVKLYTAASTTAAPTTDTAGDAYTIEAADGTDEDDPSDDEFSVSTILAATSMTAEEATSNVTSAVADGYFVIETGSGDYLALISDGENISAGYYLKDKPKATDATPTKNTSTVAHKAGTINYSGGTIALVAYDGDTSASASTKIVSSGTVENFEAATSITYTGDVNGTTPTELANAMVGLTENLHGDTKKGTATAFFGKTAADGSTDTKYTYKLEAKSLSTSDISQETLTAIVKATTRTVGYDNGDGTSKVTIDGTFTDSTANTGNGIDLTTGNSVVEINVGSTKYYAVGAWDNTESDGTLGDTTDAAYDFTPVALINEAGILVTDKSEGLYYKSGAIYAGDDNEIKIKHSLEDDKTTEKAIEILAVANATDPEVTLTLEDGKISDVTNDVFQNAEILGTNFEDYSKAVSAAGTTVSKSTDEATWRTKIQGTAIVNKYGNADTYNAALAGGAAAITYSSSDESGYTGVIALGTDATPNGGLAIIDGSGTTIANLYASFEMASSDVSTFKLTGLYTDSAATSDKAARGTTTTSSTLSHLTIKYPCNYLFYMVQCHQYIVILNEATKKGDCGHFVRVL